VRAAGENYALHAYEALARGPAGTNVHAADTLFAYVRRKHEEVRVDRVCVAGALAAAAPLDRSAKLAINVHASTLTRDPHFAEYVAEHAGRAGIALDRLIFEIVEYAPQTGPAFTMAIEKLRARGCAIALDDIGLGHSNYRMILDTRPDYYKLDRFLVKGLTTSPYQLEIVRSVVSLANAVGATVIAEGVETEEDAQVLRAAGITLFQGFLFCRPSAVPTFASGRTFGATRQPAGTAGTANQGDEMTKKILLVDDSQTVLLMHKMILSKHWQVVTARDGQEGVEKALSERPDLILMDVVMPRMNGFEAVQQLRQHDETRETPIIMVTTRGEEENVESGYELGCTDYVTKPVNNVELMTKVRCYIGQ
jgi:EAL domain-containing protein (putative c-di-GMP-specific phosphodiesterase class I)/CheY-like chemotaxis protein